MVLIVYDLTDPKSFRDIEDYWIQEAKNNSDSGIFICIVGNKNDLPIQVNEAEIKQLVHSIDLPSYFVSAKSGEGVESMFMEICQKLIQSNKLRQVEKELKLEDKKKTEKKGCCSK